MNKVRMFLFFLYLLTISIFKAYSDDLRPISYEYFGLSKLKTMDDKKENHLSFTELNYIIGITVGFISIIFLSSRHRIRRDSPHLMRQLDLYDYSLFTVLFTLLPITVMATPYIIAQSITSIELPEHSKWMITEAKVIFGKKIDLSSFPEQEKKNMLISNGMFDFTESKHGRFVLIYPGDGYGIFTYPSDFSVVFYNKELKKTVTIRFQRKATTVIKSGKIIYHLDRSEDDIEVSITPIYADFFDIESWYNNPARILVEINASQNQCFSEECESN